MIVTARLQTGQIAILGVLPNHEKATVKRFLQGIPAHLGKTIHTLCMDMYEGYLHPVQEVLSHVRIVIDRFQLAQKYRDAVIRCGSKNSNDSNKTCRKPTANNLEGVCGPPARTRDLTPEEQDRLARLFAYSPELEAAYILREELTTIFEQTTSQPQAQEQIRAWQECARHSGLSCFDDFLNTLDHW